MMKAWKAWHAFGDGYVTVVFAETRGQAKARAQHTDCLEDASWTEIRVCRVPELDKEYRGHTEMDWYDRQDRLALVRDAGMHCMEVFLDDCAECPGRDYCETWEEYLFEMSGYDEESM